jgi:LPPG:FO 2-phospho-L-lactate transferase
MRIAALAGGVGGAKLVHGLARILDPDELTVIVNTGDDLEYLGLKICPDLDTVCYTLAGLANPVSGWGRADETWNAMQNLIRLGGPAWFNLGDSDLGTHLQRTRRSAEGERLSAITRDFCARWGIGPTVLPMTDDPVATWVNTVENGWLPFQEYFVRERCNPRVISFEFRGVGQAQPAPGVVDALETADWVILCPSNPWVSIDPILAIHPIARLLQNKPVAAVSPIVGGKAIKGPAAKMYQEMGIDPSAAAVSAHYLNRLRQANSGTQRTQMAPEFVFFIDRIDAELAEPIRRNGMDVVVTNTVMNTLEDREQLARELLTACGYKTPGGNA